MAIIKEIRPCAGFEDDYARFVEKRAKVEEEVKAEFEKVLAERTSKLDALIAATSEEVEVEVPDEVESGEAVSEEVPSEIGENAGE